MTSSTAHAFAGAALTLFAEAIDAQDWPALAALLAPDFTARYCHTGKTFDAAAFVAHYVASFGAVDAAGLLTSLDEVWAEVTAPPHGERRPGTAVGGQS